MVSCQAKMIASGERVFLIQDSARGGVKKQLILRHFRKYHKKDQELTAQREEMTDSSQSTITQFVRKKGKKLPDRAVEALRRSNAQIVASAHTPLGFFGKEELRNRDRILLVEGGFDPNEVYRFDKGETTTKRDIFKISDAQVELIRRCAPSLAKKNLLAITVDHQAISSLSNQTESKAIGIGMVLSSDTGAQNGELQRDSYLLKYEACDYANHEETVKSLKKTLEERIINLRSITLSV